MKKITYLALVAFCSMGAAPERVTNFVLADSKGHIILSADSNALYTMKTKNFKLRNAAQALFGVYITNPTKRVGFRKKLLGQNPHDSKPVKTVYFKEK